MNGYEIFRNNLKILSKLDSKELQKMFKTIGASQAAFTQWKYGRRTPRVSTIKKIADYFNLTIDDILLKEIKIKYEVIVDE